MVYTAMHGVGLPFAKRAFSEFGLSPFIPISEQVEPDPEFPTVQFPNPEEKNALNFAMEKADQVNASIIFANDPDADRLAVAEKLPTYDLTCYILNVSSVILRGWRKFDGNEMGTLLGHYVWSNWKENASPKGKSHQENEIFFHLFRKICCNCEHRFFKNVEKNW